MCQYLGAFGGWIERPAAAANDAAFQYSHAQAKWTLVDPKTVWYYDSTEQQPTSPRPHSLMIRLALLSPLLALVATAISLVSLRMSQRSVEIGQRAYLSIKFQTLRPGPARIPIIGGAEAREGGIWTPKITISNLGNTPAYIDTLTINFNSNGDHGEVLYNQDDVVGYIPDVLPTKDEVVPQRDFQLGTTTDTDSRGHYSGFIRWHDTFGARHTEHWCREIALLSFEEYDCRPYDRCAPERPCRP
jgi:hypothetical protein